MTAKEQAEKLYWKFYTEISFVGIGWNILSISSDRAKRCAIMCVDFYINNHNEWSRALCCAEDFSYSYWEDVKHEISKL